MPSATPLPRGPSHLTLFGAGDLLTSAGCPLCRYVAEASDRHLIWFAMEAHGQPDTITRLCRTLGLCPRHTRGLLTQPGAGARLTVVYRYLLQAGREYLSTGRQPPDACPSCARDTEAADRALDTLLTGLRDDEVRDRYRALGGLCLPHLRFAAARSPRRQTAWLADAARPRLATGRPDPTLLTGDYETDAETRVRLRAALTSTAWPGAGARAGSSPWPVPQKGCLICLAAAQAEREELAGLTDHANLRPRQAWPGLCAAHLRDVWVSARLRDCTQDASWALECETTNAAAWLNVVASTRRSRVPGHRYIRRRTRPRGTPCAACGAWDAAERAATARIRDTISEQLARMPGSDGSWLCLRHAITLRGRGSPAAQPVTRAADEMAGLLIRELDEAFRMRTWAHRNEPRGPQMGAWQRAACFTDGRVYGGGPPTSL